MIDTDATIDTARLKHRRGVKKQLAERDLLRQRLHLAQERLRTLAAEADTAANSHLAMCEPLQQELRELEERIVNATIDRTPIPKNTEPRRLELLALIDAENEKLSDAVERIERLRQQQQQDVNLLSMQLAQTAALENQLTRLGDPQLLLQEFAAGQAVAWADARFKAAQKHIRENEDHAQRAEKRSDREQANMYRIRNQKWEAESRAAGRAVHEAQQAADTIRRRLLEE